MKAAAAKVSNDWLVESRMREKISFDLNQATNLKQLSVLFQYCEKTVLVLLNTTTDMSLVSLNTRLCKMLRIVRRMRGFVDRLFDIQNKWLYVFHFVKFSGRGEVGRESPRLFQVCSEDMKKIDMSLGQSNNSVYTVCSEQHASISTGGQGTDGGDSAADAGGGGGAGAGDSIGGEAADSDTGGTSSSGEASFTAVKVVQDGSAAMSGLEDLDIVFPSRGIFFERLLLSPELLACDHLSKCCDAAWEHLVVLGLTKHSGDAGHTGGQGLLVLGDIMRDGSKVGVIGSAGATDVVQVG